MSEISRKKAKDAMFNSLERITLEMHNVFGKAKMEKYLEDINETVDRFYQLKAQRDDAYSIDDFKADLRADADDDNDNDTDMSDNASKRATVEDDGDHIDDRDISTPATASKDDDGNTIMTDVNPVLQHRGTPPPDNKPEPILQGSQGTPLSKQTITIIDTPPSAQKTPGRYHSSLFRLQGLSPKQVPPNNRGTSLKTATFQDPAPTHAAVIDVGNDTLQTPDLKGMSKPHTQTTGSDTMAEIRRKVSARGEGHETPSKPAKQDANKRKSEGQVAGGANKKSKKGYLSDEEAALAKKHDLVRGTTRRHKNQEKVRGEKLYIVRGKLMNLQEAMKD